MWYITLSIVTERWSGRSDQNANPQWVRYFYTESNHHTGRLAASNCPYPAPWICSLEHMFFPDTPCCRKYNQIQHSHPCSTLSILHCSHKDSDWVYRTRFSLRFSFEYSSSLRYITSWWSHLQKLFGEVLELFYYSRRYGEKKLHFRRINFELLW